MRAELLRVRDVAKVDLIGVQDEKIYLEFSTQQIAALGLDINALVQTLQAQNARGAERHRRCRARAHRHPRVGRASRRKTSLKAINFRANNRFFRLSDIATVKRGYVDPPQPMFRYNGEPAIGLAVAMTTGGDALALGENIKERGRAS